MLQVLLIGDKLYNPKLVVNQSAQKNSDFILRNHQYNDLIKLLEFTMKTIRYKYVSKKWNYMLFFLE